MKETVTEEKDMISYYVHDCNSNGSFYGTYL